MPDVSRQDFSIESPILAGLLSLGGAQRKLDLEVRHEG